MTPIITVKYGGSSQQLKNQNIGWFGLIQNQKGGATELQVIYKK